MNISIFGEQYDKYFMSKALDEARKAFMHNEVPVGAVVVNEQGVIIAYGYNQVETLGFQRAHAEMMAIEEASLVVKNWRLNNCWLYVTLEPCVMCMGCARLSRLAGVVYGASSPLFGYGMHEKGESDGLMNKKSSLIEIGGIEAVESEILLKQFFHNKRIKKNE